MKMLRSDWIVVIGFLLFFTAHMTTNFLIKYYEDSAEFINESKQVVEIMEVNPIARTFFLFNNFRLLYQFVVMPVFFFGSYYYWRRKFKDTNIDLLDTIAMMVFMTGLLNASNDVSILIGILGK